MVKRIDYHYSSDESDYARIPLNKFYVDCETDYTILEEESGLKLKNMCDVDKIIEEKAGGDFSKFVLGCQANNELLPFPDGHFGAYISNLSLMLVNNYNNQLLEAYRVLKMGSAACFTIWGQDEK